MVGGEVVVMESCLANLFWTESSSKVSIAIFIHAVCCIWPCTAAVFSTEGGQNTYTTMFCGKGRTIRSMWFRVSRLQFVRAAPTDGRERDVYDWNVKSKVGTCKAVVRNLSTGQRQNRFEKTSSFGDSSCLEIYCRISPK